MKIWTVIYKDTTIILNEGMDNTFSFLLRDFLHKTWSFKPVSREWAFDIMARSALEVASASIKAIAHIDFNNHIVDIVEIR